MGIFQLGFRGRYALLSRAPSRFTQLWCVLQLPEQRMIEDGYIWIGVWTDKQRFMQVGWTAWKPNTTLANSKKYGANLIEYATDSTSYYLQPFDQLDAREGDKIVLNLQRDGTTEDWILGAYNLNNRTGGICQTYKGAGSTFHIQDLMLVLQGYTGIVQTEIKQNGQVTLDNIWLRTDQGMMTRIPSLYMVNPKGERYLGVRTFEEVPEGISTSYINNSIVFALNRVGS